MAGSGTSHLRAPEDVLIRAEHVVVEYAVRGARSVAGRRPTVHAVTDVSLDIKKGETVGLVGESGCGKSTMGRALLQLPAPTSGAVRYDGVDLTRLPPRELRRYRRDLQMIFQDPISALNPRQRVGDIIADPLRVWNEGDKAEQERAVTDVLDVVGLNPETTIGRRPHQFSGGQCQRICIARCLVLEPQLIVCDEPVSALDMSVQAQILNLLEDLKDRYGLTLLFIAHDLSVVKNISDRVAVMYLGKLCEVGDPDAIYRAPAHPYTRALLASIPIPDPRARSATRGAEGELPSPIHPPSGCRYRTRCPRATQLCADQEPTMVQIGPDQHVACHHPLTPEDKAGWPRPDVAATRHK
jgi:peptide/nickel transport system ATP-binding protein